MFLVSSRTNVSHVEVDIMRTTGHLAGRSAGFLVKKVGQGIGQAFAVGTAEVGNGIKNVSEAIGVGVVGAGINSLVSGVCEGVDNAVEGAKNFWHGHKKILVSPMNLNLFKTLVLCISWIWVKQNYQRSW